MNKVELAVLAELLLRGPQTEGELRGRASRMEPIDDLDALRPVLKSLAERNLVVYLSPEGRRGTSITHGFHPPEEIERLRSTAGTESVSIERPPPAASPAGSSDRLANLETKTESLSNEVTALRATIGDLQAQVATLTEQVRALKQALGG